MDNTNNAFTNMNTSNKFVITINREIGSGGKTVGKILAEKLDALIAQLQALRPVQKLGYER